MPAFTTRALILEHTNMVLFFDELGFGHYTITSRVTILGPPGQLTHELDTVCDVTDQVIQIKQKVTAAIIADANANGYTGLAANAILFPDMSAGLN